MLIVPILLLHKEQIGYKFDKSRVPPFASARLWPTSNDHTSKKYDKLSYELHSKELNSNNTSELNSEERAGLARPQYPYQESDITKFVAEVKTRISYIYSTKSNIFI